METVRPLLAIVAQRGWPVYHINVKYAFLNEDILEEVYMEQPFGYKIKGEEDKVLRLKRHCMIANKHLGYGMQRLTVTFKIKGS